MERLQVGIEQAFARALRDDVAESHRHVQALLGSLRRFDAGLTDEDRQFVRSSLGRARAELSKVAETLDRHIEQRGGGG